MNNMSNQELKNEIGKVEESQEYFNEIMNNLHPYVQGYILGQKSKIEEMQRKLKQQVELIKKLQGKSNNFANNIEELEERIINEISKDFDNLCEIIKKDTIIHNIFKLTAEKIKYIISHNIYEYTERISVTHTSQEKDICEYGK